MSYHASNMYDEEDSHWAARSMNHDIAPVSKHTYQNNRRGLTKTSKRSQDDPNYNEILDAERAGYESQLFNNLPLLPQPKPLEFTSHHWSQIHMDQANLRQQIRAIEPEVPFNSFIYQDQGTLGYIGGKAEGRRRQVQDVTVQQMKILHGDGPSHREKGMSHGGLPKAFLDHQLPSFETIGDGIQHDRKWAHKAW